MTDTFSFYAEAFEQADALDKLEVFASFHGADFYRLLRKTDRITLLKEDWTIPGQLRFGEEYLIPLRAGKRARYLEDIGLN